MAEFLNVPVLLKLSLESTNAAIEAKRIAFVNVFTRPDPLDKNSVRVDFVVPNSYKNGYNSVWFHLRNRSTDYFTKKSLENPEISSWTTPDGDLDLTLGRIFIVLK